MKSTLIISRHPPYSNQANKDALDAALASAAFGVRVGILLLNDGVFQLVKNQQPEVGLKRVVGIFDSLELYEVQDVFVCHSHLTERGLSVDNLVIPVQGISIPELNGLFQQYDNLLSF